MLQLYRGSGSWEIDLLTRDSSFAEWGETRRQASHLLRVRGKSEAAELLDHTPFEIWLGTNSFNDDFSLLYLEVPAEEYVRYEKAAASESKSAFRQIARALSDVGLDIRFIAVGVALDSGTLKVSSPRPQISSYDVEQALLDAEHLLATRGAPSAVDRVHTAFHAYLRVLNGAMGVEVDQEGITQLFKKLRSQHSYLQNPDVSKVLATMASIVDVVNTVRNRSSLAHPTTELLEEPEALLFINAVRTMLHYLDRRVPSGTEVIKEFRRPT